MSLPEAAQWMIRTWNVKLEDLDTAVQRCGTMVVVCSGSPIAMAKELFEEIHTQLEKQ